MHSKFIDIVSLILVSLFTTVNTLASDIAMDMRNGGDVSPSNGGYLELGVGLDYNILARQHADNTDYEHLSGTLAISGEYYRNGFFIEASEGTSDGLNVGYNFWNNETWSIDFLASSFRGSLRETDDEQDASLTNNETLRNQRILDRDTFYNGTGIRITGYLQDYVLQYRLVTDTHGGNGVVSTLRLGKNWQLRNWNFHSIISAEYNSATTNNYIYGIKANEQTARFPAFKTDASVNLSFETGVNYPVRENWVFRSFFRISPLDKDLQNSPLSQNNYSFRFSNSLNYVF